MTRTLHEFFDDDEIREIVGLEYPAERCPTGERVVSSPVCGYTPVSDT